MGRQGLAALLMLSGVALGCYDPTVRPLLGCGPHGECPGSQRCVAGVCGGQPADADLGPYDLTVSLLGPGVGSVRSLAEGIDCGTDCSHTYDSGTVVTLRVKLVNGSNLRFAGWRGACAGIDTECQVVMDGDRAVIAEFATITHNLVFVTRNEYNLRALSRVAFDNHCNAAATTAGLNNATNNGFRAWISDELEDASDGLGVSRGWVRMDGLPFTDTLTNLVVDNQILNPISLDEGGREVLALVATGSLASGDADAHCGGWKSTGMVTLGQSGGGPTTWSDFARPDCSTVVRTPIYCFQNTLNAALEPTPPAPAGKRIFVSRGSFTPGPGGLAAADTLCGRESVSGSTTPFKALLARGGQPAGALLDPAASYYTMSWQLVGTGRELLDGAHLHTGIWQHGDGSFLDAALVASRQVRTGSTRPSLVSQDCGNWESTTGQSQVGLATEVVSWWATVFGYACGSPTRLYCVEQ
ncbi:MAG: hypothetical protein IT370_23085 [Deltaproteobacteria bacterium]|nr:hypothetical protein [Deltaproteobacteria bacterium]